MLQKSLTTTDENFSTLNLRAMFTPSGTNSPAIVSEKYIESENYYEYLEITNGEITLGKRVYSSYVPKLSIHDNTINFVDSNSRIYDSNGIKITSGGDGRKTTIDGKTLENPVLVKKVDLSQMILAGNYDGYNNSNTIPSVSGYTAISAYPYASNASDVCWMSCCLENGVVNAGLKNTTSSEKTFTPSVQVLYVKNF